MAKHILSVWFPRLASDSALRRRPCEGPFALTLRSGTSDHVHCVTRFAEMRGLRRGMSLTDARAICPDLMTRQADLQREATALIALRRWMGRYAPWTAREGADGIVADIIGVAHLFGGEAGMVADIARRFDRAGIACQTGVADTRGAAFALARHRGGIAAPGRTLAAIMALPTSLLRIDHEAAEGLRRLGLRQIGDLVRLPRAPLARRFGAGLLLRLDQAVGAQAEPVSPEADPPHCGVRLTLPEPIGLTADVGAGLLRLLERLCEHLARQTAGARRLRLEKRRVDGNSAKVEIGLARPMRDTGRMAALFVSNVVVWTKV